MSHFVSYKKQLKHITNHNKYTAKQDIIKKITYCCHEQNVQITIGNSRFALLILISHRDEKYPRRSLSESSGMVFVYL